MTSFNNRSNCLRSFHNNIKFILLKEYVKNVSWILDIGCGRGGDIFKIDRCGVPNLLGLDIECAYINEAINRFNNSSISKHRNYKFHLINGNEPNISEKIHNQLFDAVSCQFALHYFFETEIKFDNLCKDISKSLNKDGYFLGTVLEGSKIRDLFINSSSFHNTCILIHAKYDINNPQPFGDSIDFYMNNTLYFGESTISKEFIVDKHVLISKLNLYGLELVSWKPFADYYDLSNLNLDTDSKFASFLYSSFVFKKKN